MSFEGVSIDIEALRRLVGHVRDAFDTLFLGGNALYAYLDDLDLSTQPATTVRTAGWWADEQVLMLDRRLSLAEGIDTYDNNLVKPSSDDLTGFPTRADAENAGRGLAGRMRDGNGNPDMSSAELEELLTHLYDPDYLRGFFDELGPAGLAWLAGDTVEGGGDYDPERARMVLGYSFAAYTRTNTLDDAWLGRFNHVVGDESLRGQEPETSFENNVMAQLLPYGTYSGQFLTLLGDRVYGGDQHGVRETGWGDTFGRYGSLPGTGFTNVDTTPFAYHAQLLEAIARDPTVAASFTDRHLDAILAESRDATYAPDSDNPAAAALARLEDARAGLVRAGALAPTLAGSAVLPAADLARVTTDAETLVAHLAFLQNADGGHVSAPMQQTYGDVLHHYTDDMYRSVTTLTPGTAALVEDGATVSAWPGGASLWSDANAAAPGVEIPAELWSALLREALRNGNTVNVLAADADVADTLLGPTTLDNANDLYIESERVRQFFAGAVGDVVTTMDDEVAQWQADARVGATDASNVLGEVGKAFSPGKSVDVVATIIKMGVEATKAYVRHQSGSDDGLTSEERALLDNLRGLADGQDWAEQWRLGAEKTWLERADNPIRSVTITDSNGIRKEWTGDPVADGFVSARGAPEDFISPDGTFLVPGQMTAGQRAAYERWLASPAIVVNNRGGREVIFDAAGEGRH